jgi:hypothetical protein
MVTVAALAPAMNRVAVKASNAALTAVGRKLNFMEYLWVGVNGWLAVSRQVRSFNHSCKRLLMGFSLTNTAVQQLKMPRKSLEVAGSV